MKKFALVMGLVLAMGAGFVFNEIYAQGDPWWDPRNPFGQSYGVTYGTVAPPVTDGLLWVDIISGAAPQLQIYDQSTASWLAFMTTSVAGITNNTIPVWDATTNAFEDSLLTDDGTNITLTSGQLLLPNGAVGAPALSWTGDTDTGLYYGAATTIRAAVGGNDRLILSAVGTYSGSVGTAAAPAFSFIDDQNTGIYRAGPDNLGITAGGALVMDLEDTNAAGAGADLVTISSTLGVMDAVGTDVVNGLLVALTNADHAGGEVNGLKTDDITGDAQALEYAYHAGTGWDAAFYHEGIAHAALQATANGSLVFCTDCDPASTPCTSAGAQTGAFAFRVNGQWDCPW